MCLFKFFYVYTKPIFRYFIFKACRFRYFQFYCDYPPLSSLSGKDNISPSPNLPNDKKTT